MAIVIVKVVELGIEATVNFTSSKVALVNVDPLNPVTLSNKTISSSNNPWSLEHVTVNVVDEAVLVKIAQDNVALIV